MSFTLVNQNYLERGKFNVTTNIQIPKTTYAIKINLIIAVGYKYRIDFPQLEGLLSSVLRVLSQRINYPYRFSTYETNMMYS